MRVQFLVYTTPAPQGSKVARVINGRAQMFEANKKMLPYRHAVTQYVRYALAQRGLSEPVAGKHIPVRLMMEFHVTRPPSVPKKRTEPSVPPDLDKYIRSTNDALKGVLYADDGQVVELRARKVYATGPAHVVISMEAV